MDLSTVYQACQCALRSTLCIDLVTVRGIPRTHAREVRVTVSQVLGALMLTQCLW
jgi:hypothetical protein